MKLANAFNFATGALVVASAVPGRKADTSSNQLQQVDHSRELAKRQQIRLDQGCRAKLLEIFNPSVVYTVVNGDRNFCTQWIDEVSKKCPDTRAWLPTQDINLGFEKPDAVLTYAVDAVLLGWVAADGATNKTIADCVVTQFYKVFNDFKGQPWYTVKLGIGIGIGAAVALGTAAGAVRVFWPKRRPRNTERAIELEACCRQDVASQEQSVGPARGSPSVTPAIDHYSIDSQTSDSNPAGRVSCDEVDFRAEQGAASRRDDLRYLSGSHSAARAQTRLNPESESPE